MMLHEDKYAFLALLNQIHDVSGIRLDILEKVAPFLPPLIRALWLL